MYVRNSVHHLEDRQSEALHCVTLRYWVSLAGYTGTDRNETVKKKRKVYDICKSVSLILRTREGTALCVCLSISVNYVRSDISAFLTVHFGIQGGNKIIKYSLRNSASRKTKHKLPKAMLFWLEMLLDTRLLRVCVEGRRKYKRRKVT